MYFLDENGVTRSFIPLKPTNPREALDDAVLQDLTNLQYELDNKAGGSQGIRSDATSGTQKVGNKQLTDDEWINLAQEKVKINVNRKSTIIS